MVIFHAFPSCLNLMYKPFSNYFNSIITSLSLPPPSPSFSKSNPLSTQDTISKPILIAGGRSFMRMVILLRGGKTMGANSVSIDQPASLSSLQPAVFTVSCSEV